MTGIDRHNGLNYNLGIVKFQLKSYDKVIEVTKNSSQQVKLICRKTSKFYIREKR